MAHYLHRKWFLGSVLGSCGDDKTIKAMKLLLIWELECYQQQVIENSTYGDRKIMSHCRVYNGLLRDAMIGEAQKLGEAFGGVAYDGRGEEMERTFITIKPDGVQRGLIIIGDP